MTNADQGPVLPVQELMASVGYLFLYWGQLETTLNSQILRMRVIVGLGSTEKPAGDITKRLSEWRQLVRQTVADPKLHSAPDEVGLEIESLRVHRNLIAHGLHSGSAEPENGQAYIVCAGGEPNALQPSTKTYTKDELDAFIQSADRCRRAIRSLYNWNSRG